MSEELYSSERVRLTKAGKVTALGTDTVTGVEVKELEQITPRYYKRTIKIDLEDGILLIIGYSKEGDSLKLSVKNPVNLEEETIEE